MSEFLQLVINGLVTGSILALAAVGVSLVYGILRVINFAHGAFLTYGAYLALLASATLGLPLPAAVILGVLGVAALSGGLERAFWRPLRNRGSGVLTLFVSSLGLALVLRGILYLVAGPNPRSYPINRFGSWRLGSVRLSEAEGLSIVIAVVVIVLVGLLFARTDLGRRIRALSNNRDLAAISGINTRQIVMVTWLLTGALAGLAGILEGMVTTSFDPNLGLNLLLEVFGAVVLGGIGSPYGALVGGLVLGVAMQLSSWSALGGGADPVWQPVVGFGVLVLVLLFRPQGLFGAARVR